MLKKLSHVNTYVFGALYLFLIPLFAIVYSTIPEHFYQSTISQEKKREKIIEKVHQYLYENHLTYQPLPADFEFTGLIWNDPRIIFRETNVAKIADNIYLDKHLSETEISLKDAYLLLRYKYEVIKSVITDPSYTKKTSGNRAITHLTKQNREKIGSFEGYYSLNPNTIKWKTPLSTFSINMLNLDGAKSKMEKNSNKTNHATLNGILNQYYLTENNHPFTSYRSSFITMLYFSTVTLTTLGYGDIVPLTNLAKLIVALESILGIILIGLFLNSIGFQRRE